MNASQMFAELRPGDSIGATKVALAYIVETGDLSPELMRVLATMQHDPEGFVAELSALLDELDGE